jgi:uncharacterized protein (DUF1330 family)
MKRQYAVAIATFVGIAIGGVAVQALHAQARLPAYVVLEIDVVNQARGGKLVNIEGPAPLISEDKRLTVVEFENMEKAQAVFASPSYSER